MQIQISLSEVQQYFSNQYNINVELKNIGVNKIEATYIDSVVLIIDEVKENMVFFHYEVDGLATIVTKVAHIFLDKNWIKRPLNGI